MLQKKKINKKENRIKETRNAHIKICAVKFVKTWNFCSLRKNNNNIWSNKKKDLKTESRYEMANEMRKGKK